MWAGIAAVTAPSAAMQIDVELIRGGDTFVKETAGYLLHDWRAGAWNTHVCTAAEAGHVEGDIVDLLTAVMHVRDRAPRLGGLQYGPQAQQRAGSPRSLPPCLPGGCGRPVIPYCRADNVHIFTFMVIFPATPLSSGDKV